MKELFDVEKIDGDGYNMIDNMFKYFVMAMLSAMVVNLMGVGHALILIILFLIVSLVFSILMERD